MNYLFAKRLDLIKTQIFFVISLGVTGFLPKICSKVSVRPEKLIE